MRRVLLILSASLLLTSAASASVERVRVPAGKTVTWESRERLPTGARLLITVRVNGERAEVRRREYDCLQRLTPVAWRLERVRVERIRRRTCGARLRPVRLRIENGSARSARVRVRYRTEDGGSFPDLAEGQ